MKQLLTSLSPELSPQLFKSNLQCKRTMMFLWITWNPQVNSWTCYMCRNCSSQSKTTNKAKTLTMIKVLMTVLISTQKVKALAALMNRILRSPFKKFSHTEEVHRHPIKNHGWMILKAQTVKTVCKLNNSLCFRRSKQSRSLCSSSNRTASIWFKSTMTMKNNTKQLSLWVILVWLVKKTLLNSYHRALDRKKTSKSSNNKRHNKLSV